MYLSGLMHRDALCEITLRWLNDDLRSDDGRRLTEIFLYESAVTGPTVQDMMLRFFQRLYGIGLSVERVRFKQALRERLIQRIPEQTPRIRQLAGDYVASPEEFFPRLPVDAILLFAPDERLVSISRIKRLQRVAEKAAYRMADALAGEIRRGAKRLAAARAEAQGVDVERLVSSEQQMHDDFVEAERRLASGFKNREIALDRRDLTINDIIGFKMIGDEEELAWAERMLAEEPHVRIVEREVHRGHYNATNLQVDIELPPVAQLVEEVRDLDWSAAAQRGLDPDAVRRNVARFVESGSRTVRTEVILTTYPELIESELGRSLHELRILRLRERQSYSGPIGENARYLIEFLLSMAYSPTVEVTELPIKLWGRYLPETLLTAVAELYGIEADRGILLRTLTLAG